MSYDPKGLAVLTVDLFATAPGDLIYIAQNLTKLAQDKYAAIEAAKPAAAAAPTATPETKQ